MGRLGTLSRGSAHRGPPRVSPLETLGISSISMADPQIGHVTCSRPLDSAHGRRPPLADVTVPSQSSNWNHVCILTFGVVPCTPSKRSASRGDPSTSLRVHAPLECSGALGDACSISPGVRDVPLWAVPFRERDDTDNAKAVGWYWQGSTACVRLTHDRH